MSPMNLGDLLGQNQFVFLLIGFAFGFVLEKSGFGDSRKLAAQFYFYEMRVLKVMFTAIITAMILIFFTSSLGLLDFQKVYVNPTYLWPGIIGGLVMGVGFIIGGFCPGTSIVGAATLKLDAIFFVIGVFLGVYFFGETEPYFDNFYNSSSYGRLLLNDIFKVDAGWVVGGVFLIAILAFYFGQWGEAQFKSPEYNNEGASTSSKNKWVRLSAVVGIVFVILTIVLKQPDAQQRWSWISPNEQPKIQNQSYHIHPLELRDLMLNKEIYLRIFDLRSVSNYNLFHLEGSQRLEMSLFTNKEFVATLTKSSSNTVFVLIGDIEKNVIDAWKLLKAQDVLNLYMLSGGIDSWLKIFPVNENIAKPIYDKINKEVIKGYLFSRSVGDSQFSSYPIDPLKETSKSNIPYEKKVKLQSRSSVKGGCG